MPLAGAEEALQQYKEREASHEGAEVPAKVEKGHERALQMLATRKASEESVAKDRPADAGLLAAYMAYIKLEEVRLRLVGLCCDPAGSAVARRVQPHLQGSRANFCSQEGPLQLLRCWLCSVQTGALQTQGDPARVACVYERALVTFPVTHFLWVAYARYMDGVAPGAVHVLYRRALRNCPWVGALWSRCRPRSQFGPGDTLPHKQRAARRTELIWDSWLAGWLQSLPDELACDGEQCALCLS